MKINKLFGSIITHPNGYPIDNNSNQHDSIKPNHSPITIDNKGDSINHEQNSSSQNKPPSKLLMPLHILSLAAYDDALITIKLLKKIGLGKS